MVDDTLESISSTERPGVKGVVPLHPLPPLVELTTEKTGVEEDIRRGLNTGRTESLLWTGSLKDPSSLSTLLRC